MMTTPPPLMVAGPSAPQMLLVFRLSGERFALAVSDVHEIIGEIPVTYVPLAPDYAPALINVRGSIAPLLDLRRRLRMPAAPTPKAARTIVLELPVDGTPTKIALIADSVEEVIETDPDALEAIPDLGARWPEKFIRGVARHGGELVILLNSETLFSPDADRPALS